MYRETTFLTDEFGLGFSVGLGYVAAPIARPASIPGVYEEDRDTGKLGLVGDKPTEFVKGPFAESFALLFPNRYPEALEVFEDNTSSGVFGSLNDFLGNGVVGGALESSLPAGELFEVSLGRRGSFLLKVFFESMDPDTDIINSFPGEEYSVRGSGEVDYAEVYAERPLRLKRRSIRDFDAKAEVENALDIEKVGLSPDPALVEFGVGAEDNRYLKPPVKAQDGDGIKTLEGEDALIVDNSGVFLKDMETLLLSPVGFGNLADSPDGKLGRESVCFSNMGITETVKPNLPELLFLEGDLGNVVAGFIKNLDSLYEGRFLFFGGKEFDFDCEFHERIVTNIQ